MDDREKAKFNSKSFYKSLAFLKKIVIYNLTLFILIFYKKFSDEKYFFYRSSSLELDSLK